MPGEKGTSELLFVLQRLLSLDKDLNLQGDESFEYHFEALGIIDTLESSLARSEDNDCRLIISDILSNHFSG